MGKASLIYVIGLSMLVGIMLMNMNGSGTDSVKNFTSYYGRTVAHDIAVSGANIGCSEAFWDSTVSTPYSNISFLGGTLNVTYTTAGNTKLVTAIGKITLGPVTYRDTVVAKLRNETLARYAWFTNLEANRGGQGSSWSTGDTAWGPAHTNDKFNINGSPVFMKKATAWQSAVPKKNTAVWAGGYEWGFKIPYPNNLSGFVTAATGAGGRSVSGKDAYLTFNTNGTIRLRVPTAGYDSTFANATAFTTVGAFAVTGANLYVQGTLTGDMAVGAVGAGGNVYIMGDVRYKTDPRTTPGSTDRLGIYAENDITVTYDNSNPSAYYDRKVDATIFSLTGEFNVQDYKSYSPRGTLLTYGAMMQYYRGGIGEINPGSGTMKSGYFKNFRYDERLATNPPKFFPAMGRYALYAWREN
jgi:hypothetical protein